MKSNTAMIATILQAVIKLIHILCVLVENSQINVELHFYC